MFARLLARPPLSPAAPRRRQTGFTLLETCFVLVVAGGLALGTMEMLHFQQMVEQGRHAGERLAALRDGAAAYLRDHGQAILSQAPDHQRCAAFDLSSTNAVPVSAAASSALAGCGLKIDGQTVANGYQPTVAELHALGYVRLTDDLPFTHGDTIVDGHTGARAVPRWRISAACSRHCAPTNGAARAVDNAPKSDVNASRPVFSLMLFNTQPFFPQGKLHYRQAAQLNAAAQAVGPDALISPPGSSPQASRKLRAVAGQPVTNPLRDAEGGVPGVLATMSYVDTNSSRAAAAPTSCGGTSGVTCQDGSAPPTQSWDFNGKDLVNVANLEVTRDLSVAEYLHAGKRLVAGTPPRPLRAKDQYVAARAHAQHATLEVNGNAYIDRDLTVGPRSGVDGRGGTLARADLRVANGNLKTDDGSLIVEGGIGDFSGGAGAFSSADIGGIRLPTIRQPGTPCGAANLGLYRAQDGVMHLVVCRPRGRDSWGQPLSADTRQGIWTLSSDGRTEAEIFARPVAR